MDIQERTASDIDTIQSLAPLIWRNPPADFVEQLPIAAYACDARGRILWFNSRAAELWGRSPCIDDDGELFCGSYKLFFDGRPMSRRQTPMAEVLRTGMPIRGAERRLERPDGSQIWTVADVAPILDEGGTIAGAINCFHERIGGRLERTGRRPEDCARIEDERLAATYEHVGAGIVEVDQDGRMLRVSQQLCHLTGYSASELFGRTIFEETLPEDVSRDRNQFRRQLAGEIGHYRIEKRIRRKDGGHFWASVTSSSVRDPSGKFLYVVRVQHDITDRKRAELELAGVWKSRMRCSRFRKGCSNAHRPNRSMTLRSTPLRGHWAASERPFCCSTRRM
jgi:PAS domain S-box-containing protein